ncbi:hypothetical protein HOO68_04355 [Candidatus Gracilibacteria bacterium]|nr:hypothetical protein [Candidatus Gracilibacteria bacterium]
MKRIFFILASWFFLFGDLYAAISESQIRQLGTPSGSIINGGGSLTVISVITIIQSFLIKVLLPIVVVGASLYIAYELFTAEGDESKLKKAWKSIAYTSIGLIAIALSYALVSIISRISL